MVCDLDYFYESDLDVTNIKEFYDTLPPHLQSKFKASLHGIQIGEGNVLQGYRGPSNMCNGGSGDSQELQPSQGLQKIKFWWGARKDMNYIPIVGPIIYIGCRTSQYFSDKLEWSSLYFDSHTGECLSHDKHEAVKKLKSRRRKVKSKMQKSVSSYDSDDDSEYREECYANMMTKLAGDLDSQRDERAIEIFQIDERIQEYRTNIANAHDEIYALNLNSQGNALFNEGRYWEALGKYQLADQIAQGVQEYRSNIAKAQVEVDALKLNCQGHNYMSQNRFDDAISMYLEARAKSKVSAQRKQYEANADKAKAEADADIFNYQGNKLFKEGNYTAALRKYQDACNTSERFARIKIYRANLAKAQAEIEALNLNAQGDSFFNVGRYNDAVKMHLEAHSKSKVSAQSQKYKANADRAKAEVDAANFNSQGDNFFNEGKFKDALSKYQLAGNTSQVAAQIQKYKANIAKAQVEINALKLNVQGNNFFNAGRYNDAVKMYLEAYSKSQTTTQKDVYLSNKNIAEDVINKLNKLDTLWNEAWDVENDTKTDRSAEAKDLFQKILSESQENLKSFPENSKFEQFKALAALKIEGNELFNEGINSQENGMALFEEAQELNQQEKYQLANQKFKEAKKYFQEALEKFENGSKSDQRFAACVGFVQDLFNEVMDSIKITEQCMISERLNKLDITIDKHSGAHSRETNVTEKHNNYSQHI